MRVVLLHSKQQSVKPYLEINQMTLEVCIYSSSSEPFFPSPTSCHRATLPAGYIVWKRKKENRISTKLTDTTNISQ